MLRIASVAALIAMLSCGPSTPAGSVDQHGACSSTSDCKPGLACLNAGGQPSVLYGCGVVEKRLQCEIGCKSDTDCGDAGGVGCRGGNDNCGDFICE